MVPYLSIPNEDLEIIIGNFLSQHPLALKWASELVNAANRYMQIRAEFNANLLKTDQEHEMEKMLTICSQYVFTKYGKDQFAGRIDGSIKSVSKIYNGIGNLREILNHVYKFMTQILAPDVIGKTMYSNWRQLANQANLNVSKIEELRAIAVDYCCMTESSSIAPIDIDPYKDFIKMPWNKVIQEHNRMRILKTIPGTRGVWSTIKKQDFLQLGGSFSKEECLLRNEKGTKFVPWLDPTLVWNIDDRHPWIQAAAKAGYPIKTGLSGITSQYLIFAECLNVTSDLSGRLACLGYLMPIRAHSFHEIMTAAEITTGCPYADDCDYSNLDPLHLDEIKEGVRQTVRLGTKRNVYSFANESLPRSCSWFNMKRRQEIKKIQNLIELGNPTSRIEIDKYEIVPPKRDNTGWATIEIFLSSTFWDMQSEREYLKKIVVPALNEVSKKLKVQTRIIDLQKWGFETDPKNVLINSLKAVDRCKPFLIALVGERYGIPWETFPYSKEIKNNSIYNWIYNKNHKGCSVMELELRHGFLNIPDKSIAFFYFRDNVFLKESGFLRDIKNSGKKTWNAENCKPDISMFVSTDNYQRTKLQKLKKELLTRFPSHVFSYSCMYDRIDEKGRVVFKNLESFGSRVFLDLWSTINTLYTIDNANQE